ncbi:MAG TPA: Gfo/Idh/MocA family oxidoreductase [Pirellulales bacterium]|jgi:predicted dehydrogenase|nr:Gfo/Idh/MocA family oxidoreductase [Pirellulales bacterium]
MARLSRRKFLQTTVAASAAFSTFTIAGTKSSGKVLGANDTIRIGVAGINGRGGSHIDEWKKMKGVEITYLIDPDSRIYGKRTKPLEAEGFHKPTCVADIRHALEDKELDAVSIATPNHWHSLIAIWACQAGKDVYVEKPCSHNVHEGRVLVDTARKYDRIVQHGTQSRSGSEGAIAAAIAASGKFGKLVVSRGLCYKPRASIGFKQPSDPPAGLDFNIWLGPAPEQPYHGNLVHYNWHWFWDTGCGDIGNQGVHEIDKARWAISGATLPKSVFSLGGRFGYEDQGQTPNTQMAVFDYGDTQLIFEVRGLTKDKPSFHGQQVGNVYHYEGGVYAGGKFTPKDSDKPVALPKFDIKHGPGNGHFGNFIAAVRSHKKEDLNAEILEGHYSAALCHLANISYRLGEEVPFNPQTKAFGDNQEAYETLARLEEHLASNGVKLEATKYRLGRKLAFDAASEKFVGDDQANALLTRKYRAPFVVPDKA